MKTDIGFSFLKYLEAGTVYHYADLSWKLCNMIVNNGGLR
jgi:hypothetical protein